MKNKSSPKKSSNHGPGPVMLDVVGLSLTADDLHRLQHPLTGGVILFARNYASRTQLVALTNAIRAARPNIMIAVDHEGGRVQRFKTDGFTHLPAMRRLGEIWDSHAEEGAASGPTVGPIVATQAATAVGYVLAAELVACGIDLSFTPVLDLDYGASEVIGNRAFHADPRVVALLAKSLNHGLMLAGMANCGKHFPGHGYVAADSHLAIPVDERPLEDILAADAQPYQWLGPALAGVMPAHVIYSECDPMPAGFSEFWLQDILRQRLGFGGVIFSDDLSMEGASVAGSVVEGAHAALAAGCDMVLVCNAPERADELLAGLRWRIETHHASAVRMAALKPKFNDPRNWDVLQCDTIYLQAKKELRRLELIA